VEVRVISMKEIESLGISIVEIMDVVEKGFKLKGEGKVELPAKIGIHPRHDCFIHAMPCYVGGGSGRSRYQMGFGIPDKPRERPSLYNRNNVPKRS